MISPAQQHRTLGACVHADGDMVIFQVGTQMTALRPEECRKFIDWMAQAYYRAHMMEFKAEVKAAAK